MEAESYATVKDKDVKTIVWKNLMNHFRLLQVIITYNDSQFVSDSFRVFCLEWKIQLRYSMLRHLQRNGQVEATNKILLNIIKKTLDEL